MFRFYGVFARAFIFAISWLVLDLTIRSLYISKDATSWQWQPAIFAFIGSFGCGLGFACIARFLKSRPKRLTFFLAIISLFYSVLLISNCYLFQFFGEYLFPSALTFITTNLSYIGDYLKTFGSFFCLIAFVGLYSFYFCLFYPWGWQKEEFYKKSYGIGLFLGVILAFIGIKAVEKETRARIQADVISIHSLSKHFLRVSEDVWPLKPAQRFEVILNSQRSIWKKPSTVIVIVNESMGVRHVGWLGSDTSSTPRLDRLFKEDSLWILYKNALTNATATNVSMPSIYSGVSPEESYQKLHQLPMMWDLAKAAQYKTVYLTSQRLKWACLWDFLMKEPIDYKWSYENLNLPIVNDMGADDFDSFAPLIDLIRKSQEPLFVFINTNAMHAPHQNVSSHFSIAEGGERYDQSLSLLDRSLDSLFGELKKAGRYEDALIFMTGDHGETPKPLHPLPRVANFYEEIIRLPMVMKIPQSWHDSLTFFKNQQSKLVSNIDLLPTLADAFGVSYAERKTIPWSGFSWLKTIPSSRKNISMSTNALRKWDKEGFAIAESHYRLVCHTYVKCEFFNLERDPIQINSSELTAEDSVVYFRLKSKMQENSELKRIWNVIHQKSVSQL